MDIKEIEWEGVELMWLRVEKSNLPPKFICSVVHESNCYYLT